MTRTVKSHPLISIRSTATIQEAAKLMSDCSIGALGVIDSHQGFAGIVTERDLTHFVMSGGDPAETFVRSIVNDLPVVVKGPLDDDAAIEQMRRARVRHLIVTEDGDHRIVSMRDYVIRAPDAGPTVREVMTAPAVACREDAFFEEVAEILAERDISGMPVVDADGVVVGVISERDLAYALGGPMVRLALRRPGDHPLNDVSALARGARRAKEIMTSPALTVSLDATLQELARLMRVHQVNRIPVLDGGRLVGVVTRGDVLGALAHLEHAPIDIDAPPILVGSGAEAMQGMYE